MKKITKLTKENEKERERKRKKKKHIQIKENRRASMCVYLYWQEKKENKFKKEEKNT